MNAKLLTEGALLQVTYRGRELGAVQAPPQLFSANPQEHEQGRELLARRAAEAMRPMLRRMLWSTVTQGGPPLECARLVAALLTRELGLQAPTLLKGERKLVPPKPLVARPFSTAAPVVTKDQLGKRAKPLNPERDPELEDRIVSRFVELSGGLQAVQDLRPEVGADLRNEPSPKAAPKGPSVMACPECGTERYREAEELVPGVSRCEACDVLLEVPV